MELYSKWRKDIILKLKCFLYNWIKRKFLDASSVKYKEFTANKISYRLSLLFYIFSEAVSSQIIDVFSLFFGNQISLLREICYLISVKYYGFHFVFIKTSMQYWPLIFLVQNLLMYVEVLQESVTRWNPVSVKEGELWFQALDIFINIWSNNFF